jgi:hypothetical protein
LAFRISSMFVPSKTRHSVLSSVQPMQWFVLVMGVFFAIDVFVFLKDPNHWTFKSMQFVSRTEVIQDDFAASRVGTVMINGPHGECRRYKYDNDTAESFPVSGTCDSATRRGGGGTATGAGRMEAISKYFLEK